MTIKFEKTITPMSSSPANNNSPSTIASATRAAHSLALEELAHGTRTAASDGRSLIAEHPSLGLLDIGLCSASISEGSYFVREAGWIEQLQKLRAHARSFISLVYAYRGCFKAVPTFNGPTQGGDAAKAEYYRLVEEIVKPEIIKMKHLMEFYTTAESALSSICNTVAASLISGYHPTETLSLCIATTIDSLMTLDALKNVKTALNNDYTLIFRRSRSISKTQGDDKENQMLYLFLANKDVFLGKLKAMVPQIPGMDDLLWELSIAMADRLDRGHWANPREKFALVKATAYAMVVLDPLLTPKLMSAKHWKIDRIAKVFRTHPVIPLYGDLAITLAQLLNGTVNQKWLLTNAGPSSKSGSEPGSPIGGASAVIHGKELIPIAEVRTMSTDYLAKLALSLATVRKNRTEDLIDGQCSEVFNTLVEGIQLLNSLTTLVLEMNAYKYTHPTNHSINADCPETALNYEMAIRYNYSQEERFALAEVISTIKSIEEKVVRSEIELNAAICKHKSIFMNSIKQMSLTNMMSHVVKKKRAIMHSMLKSLSELVGPDMITSASTCFMASGIVEWIVKASAVKPSGFLKERDLKDAQISEIHSLQHELYWLQLVHDLPHTVRQIVDLSELWYKEFYLDLSKQIQFPIETSLPWILINTMLDSSAVDLTQSLFVPFAIYDDAAHRALYELNMQFLYDEIEAEANLALDLFIYKYSSKLFKAFKCHAASNLFATQFKAKLDKPMGLDPPFHQHTAILKSYKTVNILRRCIPFTQIVSQMMNVAFRRSLEAIVARFESSEITGIMELDQLLSVLRHTHHLLSMELRGMDPFDDMVKDVDEGTVGGGYGRIFAHVVSELERSFTAHFSYNNITARFVRNPIPRTGTSHSGDRAAMRQHKHEFLFGTKFLYQAYSAQLAPYLMFVGKPHFDAIVRVLGYRVPLLYSELAAAFEAILRDKLTPYLWALAKGFPGSCKLPGLDYGVVGTYKYFKVILKNTVASNDLVVVFQALREMGNLFLCIQHLESSMFATDAFNTHHLSNAPDIHAHLTPLFNMPPVQSDLHANIIRPESGTCQALVRMFMTQLLPVVTELCPLWTEGLPMSSSYDTSRDLYRVASFLQFAFCSGSTNTRGYTCREVFGDGVHWALGLLLCWARQMDIFMALDFTFHVCYAGKVHGVPNSPVPDDDNKDSKPMLVADYIHLGEYYKTLMMFIDRYYQATVGEPNLHGNHVGLPLFKSVSLPTKATSNAGSLHLSTQQGELRIRTLARSQPPVELKIHSLPGHNGPMDVQSLQQDMDRNIPGFVQ